MKIGIALGVWSGLGAFALVISGCGNQSTGQPSPSSRTTTVAQALGASTITWISPVADFSESRRLLRATLSDSDGIASVTYSVNGGAATSLPVSGSPTTLTISEAMAARAGDNSVSITITDALSNVHSEYVDFRYGLDVTAGAAHSGALVAGELFVWGRNNVGQLGLGGSVGDSTSRTTPESLLIVSSPRQVESIAFNQNHSLAVIGDGAVYTWGSNASGQLGVGDTTDRNAPTATSLTNAIYGALGYSHSLVLRSDGSVYAWGSNATGQLGDGTTDTTKTSPTAVTGLPSGIVKVVGGSTHSAALTKSGLVYVWGDNGYGQLGDGTTDANRHATPTLVPNLTDVIDIATGANHLVALTANGSAYAWGNGTNGQLGYGDNSNPSLPKHRYIPTQVQTDALGTSALANVRQVFANGNTSYVLLNNGQYWGFGQNFSGQLAAGSSYTSQTFAIRAAVTVTGSPTQYLDQSITIRALGVGATHTIAHGASSPSYGWGWDYRGSLAQEQTNPLYTPAAQVTAIELTSLPY
ncbi:MAG: Regulator of chromosome condensation [Labilithrix sp.]|nr:Regulator of chromosome condensation [Labilithrix sp.]